jgi:hypothetical protein
MTNSKVSKEPDSRLVMDLATEILAAMILARSGESIDTKEMVAKAIAMAKEIVKQSKNDEGFRTKNIT